MFVIGLTGGIGSGKTTVSNEFEALGVDVIDADIAARAVVEKGSPTLNQIKDAFGENIITPKGELNRPVLRQLVFSTPSARQQLNNITHPAIQNLMNNQLKQVTSDYAILVIPLLQDTQTWGGTINRVLVVDVDEHTQIQRVMARDNQTQKQAENALASQISRDARLALADDVILNNQGISHIQARVAELHKKYIAYAQTAQP